MPYLDLKNPKDREVFETLEAMRYGENVLRDISPADLKARSGFIKIMCPDGDQIEHKFQQANEWCQAHGIKLRAHPLTYHGGAGAIVEDSPMNSEVFRNHLTVVENIKIAKKVKGFELIVLAVHFPCGMACACNVGVVQSLELLLAAREYLVDQFPDMQVVPFVHVAWPDKKRYYFLKAREFNAFKNNSLVKMA